MPARAPATCSRGPEASVASAVCNSRRCAARCWRPSRRPGRPQGAYDIAERLSAPGKRVAPVSVYRALDFLSEQGLVHRIASRNAFIPCAHGHAPGEGVVFLICRTCGGVDETSSQEIEGGSGAPEAGRASRRRHSILEVEGDCGACSQQSARPEGEIPALGLDCRASSCNGRREALSGARQNAFR